MDNGHITHFTFAVTDVDKGQISGGSNHGNKVIVMAFDGVSFDAETGVAFDGGAGGSTGTGGIPGGSRGSGAGGTSGTGGMRSDSGSTAAAGTVAGGSSATTGTTSSSAAGGASGGSNGRGCVPIGASGGAAGSSRSGGMITGAGGAPAGSGGSAGVSGAGGGGPRGGTTSQGGTATSNGGSRGCACAIGDGARNAHGLGWMVTLLGLWATAWTRRRPRRRMAARQPHHDGGWRNGVSFAHASDCQCQRQSPECTTRTSSRIPQPRRPS